MSAEFSFERKHQSDDALVDVIFIHGLTGDSTATWSNKDGGFWPTWLHEDLNRINVYTLGYPSDLLGKWAKKEMTLYERAKSILDYLASFGEGVWSTPNLESSR